MSQVSHTTGTPLGSILFHRFEACSHGPRAKHQASTPSLPILFQLKSIFVTVLLTVNASKRACGQQRCQTKPCQTMSNLRTYNAIWDNMRPLSFPHNEYQQTAEVTISRYEEKLGGQGELQLEKRLYQDTSPISMTPLERSLRPRPDTWTPFQHHQCLTSLAHHW